MKVNNYANTKRFWLVWFLIAALTLICVTVFGQETAYLVSYDSSGVLVAKKVYSIEAVEVLMKKNLTRLKEGKEVYMNFYAEKKRVTKSGKLKRIRK